MDTSKPVRIAVVSDTHGVLSNELLQKIAGCDRLIHAGDFSSFAIARELDTMLPMVMVRGNNDRFLGYGELDDARFQIGGLNFYVLHSRYDRSIPPETDVVIFGHTHQFYSAIENGRLFLNPGSPTRPRGNHEKTMAILTVTGRSCMAEKVVLNPTELLHTPGSFSINFTADKLV